MKAFLAKAKRPAENSALSVVHVIAGASPEETKKLRTDRAEKIRLMSKSDFEADKDALMLELSTLKGLEPGWCNEAAGIVRTRDGAIHEVTREGQGKRRAVAWTYVAKIVGAAVHCVVCLLCFLEVQMYCYFVYITCF
jgi:hypothetical protein